jgi:hypothetical protein
MVSKKILLKSLFAILASGSMTLSYADLTITNNTNFDSTTITNKGSCSTILGEHGVTHPHSTNQVSRMQLLLACGRHVTDCEAQVFMTNNCTGSPIADVMLSEVSGIYKVDSLDPTYQVVGTGWNVAINGGPALAKK